MKRRELVKLLKSAGFKLIRDDGDHSVYRKEHYPIITVPRHRELNEFTALSILKAAGIR